VSAHRVLLATRNDGKLVELRRILAAAASDVELVGLDDAPPYGEVAETGLTFAENALLKARAGVRATGLVTVADDSGLAVDALNGMPGVFSARWSGRKVGEEGRDAVDAANLDLLLAQLADVPEARRGASFVCAAALVTPDGAEQVVEGTVAGTLLDRPRGDGGFGYDPIFVPYGHDRTTAEMEPAEKDALSHRGQAFRALAPLVADAFGVSVPASGGGAP
jgi:XTP/dITP diphosphohydrolase